ncbi:hypothetical protein [Streptomyces sp. NPDC056296]|uniref:hypothetical protein n=1 Tax=Streptomyces sp. NPDC056296 TaxID=3345775 RepID=UPI0035DA4B64
MNPRRLVGAGSLNAALRAAVEHHAWHTADTRADAATARTELAATLRTAVRAAADGLT